MDKFMIVVVKFNWMLQTVHCTSGSLGFVGFLDKSASCYEIDTQRVSR